jgi:hypothetical protein
MVAGRRRWALTLGLLGIFAAGAATGVFATAAYVHHRLRALHEAGPHAVQTLGVAWLDGELDLTLEQEAAIEGILSDTHLELFRFKSEHNEEIRAIALPALERIDAALLPRQAERWGPIRARIREHVEATVETHGGH